MLTRSPGSRGAVRPAPWRRQYQAGLSLVEMLVGIAIGLIIVAAASMTVATQLSDNRRLLMEMQLQQDLRAATDTISRELRRAGFWALSGDQVPLAGTKVDDIRNPRSTLTPSTGAVSKLEYEYDRSGASPSTNGANRFGFCFGSACPSASPGTVRSKMSPSFGDLGIQWNEVTDEKAVRITALTITPVVNPPVKMACPTLCPGTNDTACWPTVAVREAIITITGEAVGDSSVQRTLSSRVRLRNEVVNLFVPGTGPAGSLLACPA